MTLANCCSEFVLGEPDPNFFGFSIGLTCAGISWRLIFKRLEATLWTKLSGMAVAPRLVKRLPNAAEGHFSCCSERATISCEFTQVDYVRSESRFDSPDEGMSLQPVQLQETGR